jgi:hypothetical protein
LGDVVAFNERFELRYPGEALCRIAGLDTTRHGVAHHLRGKIKGAPRMLRLQCVDETSSPKIVVHLKEAACAADGIARHLVDKFL